MALSELPCLIGQTGCGRVAGQPVCAKCGMDERVVFPSESDREAAQAAALARYEAAQMAVKPPPPPKQPKPPTPPEPPAQPPKQPEPESPVTPGPDRKGINRLGVGVLVLALMGGGWWWKDQQDQRVQQAEEQVAQQALAVEQARREREVEKKRADEAEVKRIAAEKAQAQLGERAAEAARHVQAERAAQLARAKQADLAASKTAPSPSPTQPANGALLHGRYQILAGGSEVKDVQTGLVWARCSVGQRWDGRSCYGKAKIFKFESAKKLVGKGWRLPTIQELYSLVWCSSGQVSEWINREFAGGYCEGEYKSPTINAPIEIAAGSYAYLTGSERPSLYGVWEVHFDNGYASAATRNDVLHVLLVRAIQ